MTTLQEHAAALPAQTHAAAGGRNAAFLHLEFTHALPLLLLELLQDALLLPALPAENVPLPEHEEESGAGGESKHEGQDPPHPDAVHLLPQERRVVLPGEEIAEALFRWLQLDQVVIQDQFSHSRQAVANSQHLLRLVDPFGSFSADEVADDVGQGLDCGVEVLIGGFQVQLRCV